jgi:hypothetical protein
VLAFFILPTRLLNSPCHSVRGQHLTSIKHDASIRESQAYRLFKNNYKFENDITEIKTSDHRKALTKLRISTHDSAIERGRYKGKSSEERTCTQCSSGEVEDEFHFLTICKRFTNEREPLFRDIDKKCTNFMNLDNHNRPID